MNEKKMIKVINQPVTLKYNYTAGAPTARFLKKLKEGKIVGQRCPSCSSVLVPPRGCCAKCGVVTQEEVALSGKGTVLSFTIVHLPIQGSPVQAPFIAAEILLDGADVHTLHLVSGVPNEAVRIGMRVEPVWKEKQDWTYSMNNIMYFKPTNEPDIDIDALRGKKS